MTSGRFAAAIALAATLTRGDGQHDHHPPVATADGWAEYRHQAAGFSFEYPADWKVESAGRSAPVHVSHPTRPGHVFAAAFTMTEGTLRDFADLKFAVQAEVFAPVGETRALDGPGWSGLVQEAKTTQPQEERLASRVMLCAGRGHRYVTLTLYIDTEDLARDRKHYERIFTSLRFTEAK